jgi:hypothetical protein
MATHSEGDTRIRPYEYPGGVEPSSIRATSGIRATPGTMRAKGTVVATAFAFVKDAFPNRYEEYVAGLPEATRQLASSPILPSSMYDLDVGIVQPAQRVCELFFGGSTEGALKLGEYSADRSLTGIYKMFIQLGTPKFFLDRARVVAANTYEPAQVLGLADYRPGRAVVTYTCEHFPHWVTLHRTAGFARRGLELCGCKDVSLSFSNQISRAEPRVEVVCTWR